MSFNRTRLNAVLLGNTFLRGSMAASGGNALVGFYLASLAVAGRPVDAALVGNLNATLDACALLVAVPLGALIDRTSPRLMLVGGALLGAIATQLFGISGVIAIFFLSRGLEGVAASATTPAILSHLTDATQTTPALRGRVMSWFEISLFAGLALGNLISGPLWERFATGGFAILAFGYVIAALLFNWGAQRVAHVPHAAAARDALQGLREAIAEPLLRRLALPWLMFNAVVGLWLSQLAFQLNGPPRDGQWLVGLLRPTEVALYLFGYTLVFTVGVYVGGISIGRYTRVALMRIAFVAMFGVTLFVYLLNGAADWSNGQRLLVLLGYALFAGTQGTFPPAALSYLADVAGNTHGRGSAMGIYTLLLSLGNIIGSLLGGVLGNAFALNGLLIGTLLLATLGLLGVNLLPATLDSDSHTPTKTVQHLDKI